MLGQPKYEKGQFVSFNCVIGGTPTVKSGTIYIVDKYGTFRDNSDVSYDIIVEEDGNMLYKHINEKFII